jgi:hypothetical protein
MPTWHSYGSSVTTVSLAPPHGFGKSRKCGHHLVGQIESSSNGEDVMLDPPTPQVRRTVSWKSIYGPVTLTTPLSTGVSPDLKPLIYESSNRLNERDDGTGSDLVESYGFVSKPPNFLTWKPELSHQSMRRLANFRPIRT